jgi:glycosyltransferase involved in cell wall biosynthesis
MIKLFIANNSGQKLGGGFTFIDNFINNSASDIELVEDFRKCDIYFIPSSSMVADKHEVDEAKALGKKIVLRVDNIPRNSRNRNTGTSRLFSYSQIADLVIYQSEWARDFIKNFTKKDGPVIHNGVDLDLFCPAGDMIVPDGSPQYLYSRFNRDETKRWEEAWYYFQRIFFENPNAHLWIVGSFGDELVQYNFDFFGGAEKRIKYFGVIDDKKELAKLYRSSDVVLIPYFNDACSNTVLEAMASGCKIETCLSGRTGGTEELLKLKDISVTRMVNEYLDEFKKLL